MGIDLENELDSKTGETGFIKKSWKPEENKQFWFKTHNPNLMNENCWRLSLWKNDKPANFII
jgi:hypothetical protein